jgi:hypothetical protein
MTRIATLTVALAVLMVAPESARADRHRVDLKASGTGVFAPANIGVGTPGTPFILGDGSGLSAYQAAGEDFRLDGEQLGHNSHTGAVQTSTAGLLDPDTLTVHWPCASAPNPYLEHGNRKVHVMSSDAGDIHLTYRASGTEFVLDLATGP